MSQNYSRQFFKELFYGKKINTALTAKLRGHRFMPLQDHTICYSAMGKKNFIDKNTIVTVLYIDSTVGNNWIQAYGVYPAEFVHLKYMKDVENIYVQKEVERQKNNSDLSSFSKYRETIIGISLLVFVILLILVSATSKGSSLSQTDNNEEMFITKDNSIIRYGERNIFGEFEDKFGNTWVKKDGPLRGYSKK